jgi:hypothetical protein
MYYTIALTFASTLGGQTRWSEAYFKESFKNAEVPPRPPARKVPLGRDCFSAPIFSLFATILTGWVLAPGRRTA